MDANELALRRSIRELAANAVAELRVVYEEADTRAGELQGRFRAELSGLLMQYHIDFPAVRVMTDSQKMDLITTLVTEHFGVPLSEVMSQSRRRQVVLPRQVAMTLIYRYVPISTTQLGRYFDGRDHTTVGHALDRVAKLATPDSELSASLSLLSSSLGWAPVNRKPSPMKGVAISDERKAKLRRSKKGA